MAIRFTCICGHHLKARDQLAGRRTMCPACGARWRDVYPLSGYVLYAPDDVVPASGYVVHTPMVSRADDTCPVDGTPGGQSHGPQR